MLAPLLSAADMAAWLKVNIETVYDLIAQHQLPAIKIGGQWRFVEAQVREWLEGHTAAHKQSDSYHTGTSSGGPEAAPAK